MLKSTESISYFFCCKNLNCFFFQRNPFTIIVKPWKPLSAFLVYSNRSRLIKSRSPVTSKFLYGAVSLPRFTFCPSREVDAACLSVEVDLINFVSILYHFVPFRGLIVINIEIYIYLVSFLDISGETLYMTLHSAGKHRSHGYENILKVLKLVL